LDLSNLTAVELTALAKRLPDIARFVETRAMLLANQCEIFGLDETAETSFVVRNLETGTISVIGNPASEAIIRAIEPGDVRGNVLAFDDNFSFVETALPHWRSEKATLHLLSESPSFPIVPDGMVRFLGEGEISSLPGVSDELKQELMTAAKQTQIAATIIDNQPVSFCYAGAITETLWDISIDTVAGFRHQGFAALSVAFMIDYFKEQGKKPVWGALVSNTASMKLAAKLGFVPMDELFVFER
jgi:RimJ/RimL family protein N-acetyltransferase